MILMAKYWLSLLFSPPRSQRRKYPHLMNDSVLFGRVWSSPMTTCSLNVLLVYFFVTYIIIIIIAGASFAICINHSTIIMTTTVSCHQLTTVSSSSACDSGAMFSSDKNKQWRRKALFSIIEWEYGDGAYNMASLFILIRIP